MKSTKMEKFQEQGMKNLSALNLNEMAQVKGGDGEQIPPWRLTLTFSLNVEGFFDGSLFQPGSLGDRINELD